jgi:hypothetical protein
VTKNEHITSDTSTQDGRVEDPEKAEATQDATDEESGTRSPPATELQRWNQTTADVFRFFSTIYCFILMGMTDGAVGVCSYPRSQANRTHANHPDRPSSHT